MESRNYLSDAGATPPAAPGSPSNGYPQPAVPGVSDATVPGPHWFYKIGEALRSIITGSGQTPSDADLNQVLKGLKRFSGGNVTTLDATATLTLDQAGLILIDASAGDVTATLPSAADFEALEYTIIRIDSSANTITIDADGTETIDGAASVSLSAGNPVTLKSDGVDQFYAKNRSNMQLQSIAATVAANALTLSLNPTSLDFRSATLNEGDTNTRSVPLTISLTISSGSTLGTTSAQQSRLAVLAIDNAGTVELAVANLDGGLNLDETTLISTTAEGGAGGADSADVIYSENARSNVPFRVVGFIDITEAVAGTWDTAPTTVQGAGGNAATSLQSIGYSKPQEVSGSRSFGTTYYNTSGRPMLVIVRGRSSLTATITMNIDGSAISSHYKIANTTGTVCGVVPPGSSYDVNWNTGTKTMQSWNEQI